MCAHPREINSLLAGVPCLGTLMAATEPGPPARRACTQPNNSWILSCSSANTLWSKPSAPARRVPLLYISTKTNEHFPGHKSGMHGATAGAQSGFPGLEAGSPRAWMCGYSRGVWGKAGSWCRPHTHPPRLELAQPGSCPHMGRTAYARARKGRAKGSADWPLQIDYGTYSCVTVF